jgi:opacity protein-like surface antigen
MLMTLLVISSLMIAPALAQTLTRTQDQQTRTASPVIVAAADKTPSTVVAPEEAVSSQKVVVRNKDTKRKKVVIGNKVTKRYLVFGMPGYNKVKKNHRIYFNSEKQAIAHGYNKAGIGKDLTGRVSPAGGKTTKNQTILIAADFAESEKSSPEALQKNEKILETKAQDTPKTVEEPQKLSGENIQKKTVNKETVTNEPKDINQKLQDLQNQVDILRELGRTREKITIGTTEDKAEQEKAVLTAAGREYTMMQKGKIELQYSLGYQYVSSSAILSATSVVPRANQTITNAIDVQYGLLKNVTTGIHVPFVYVYDKTGSATAKDNSDMGDISLNLSYQPFKNSGDWPTTAITMGATLPTGRSPYEINRDTDLPTGGGLYGVSLGVNMSKSIDPAMAFGAISCSYNLERDGLSQNISGAMLDDVKPGMGFNAAIGLAYSISYALSMNVAFQYGYIMSTDYHFTNAAPTSTPAFSTGSLTVGIGYRVSPVTTLSLGLSIGLTNNDPDFSFLLRVPFGI